MYSRALTEVLFSLVHLDWMDCDVRDVIVFCSWDLLIKRSQKWKGGLNSLSVFICSVDTISMSGYRKEKVASEKGKVWHL